MKALIILLMAPMMMLFTLAALQTIEWSLQEGYPIPLAAYFLLAVVFAWGYCAIKCSKEELEEALKRWEKWMDTFLKKFHI